MIHLANILENINKRLIVVGAGSLFVDKEKNNNWYGKNFPESWRPLSKAHDDGLNYLRQKNNLNWTYISPDCNFIADGKRTGEYKLGEEKLNLLNILLENHI